MREADESSRLISLLRAGDSRNPRVGEGMSYFLTSKQARRRLAYTAMSLLVAWHTLATILAPSPDSAITQSARRLFHPYLALFGLDNTWGFFAPNIPEGFKFQYSVEDAAGSRRIFVPVDSLNVLQPTWIWFLDRYKLIMEYPENFAAATVASLCQEHAALNPVSVTLIGIEQKKFLSSDWLNGKRPFDSEFVEVNPFEPMRCPGK
jgi:hypothetical protein